MVHYEAKQFMTGFYSVERWAMKQFGSSFVNLRRDIAKREELNFST